MTVDTNPDEDFIPDADRMDDDVPNPEFDQWEAEQERLAERDEDPAQKHIPCTEEEEQQFEAGMLGL